MRLAGDARFADSGFTLTQATGPQAPAIADAAAAVPVEATQFALGSTTELILPTAEEVAAEPPDGVDEELSSGIDDNVDDDGGTLGGTAGDDRLQGGDGADTLRGLAGNDRLEGHEGNDILDGGDGEDVLIGGAGNDVLRGGGGHDRTEGGLGDDIHRLREYQDVAFESPGEGNDTVVIEARWAESLTEAWPSKAADGQATFVLGRDSGLGFPDGLASFRQQVNVEVENITLEGDKAHDVLGDERDNAIAGNDADNELFGRAGDDRLAGGAGDDLLDGGAGDDWLDGGAGEDMLYGGAGDDTYLLGLAEADTVFDHEGVNRLKLDGVDADRLSASMAGGDLVLRNGDRTLATIEGYDAGNWAGIELDGVLRSLDEFGTDAAVAKAADWLDGFIDPAVVGSVTRSNDPWASVALSEGDQDPWAPLPAVDHASLGQGFAAEEADDPARRHPERSAA